MIRTIVWDDAALDESLKLSAEATAVLNYWALQFAERERVTERTGIVIVTAEHVKAAREEFNRVAKAEMERDRAKDSET